MTPYPVELHLSSTKEDNERPDAFDVELVDRERIGTAARRKAAIAFFAQVIPGIEISTDRFLEPRVSAHRLHALTVATSVSRASTAWAYWRFWSLGNGEGGADLGRLCRSRSASSETIRWLPRSTNTSSNSFFLTAA
jgi:hypothetical protein